MSIPSSILKDISTISGKIVKPKGEVTTPRRTKDFLEQTAKLYSPGQEVGLTSTAADALEILAPSVEKAADSSELPDLFSQKVVQVTRKEVVLLKNTMLQLLEEIGAEESGTYPSELHLFLDVVQKEQRIYDQVFSEIIRQVSLNMVERGTVLSELRKRYSGMFTRIPRHIQGMHTELVAQRKLNRRLSEELVRARETANELLQELEYVRAHDAEVTRNAQETQDKLVTVLTQSDTTDEVLEEYHKLYNMQRSRLEDTIRVIELEKSQWIDAATALALRVAIDTSAENLIALQKKEQVRYRISTHLIVSIAEGDHEDLGDIERQIEDWRNRLVRASAQIIEADHKNLERLSKMQKEMKMMVNNISANSPMDEASLEHPVLSEFYLFDLKNILEFHSNWLDEISTMVVRFTSDKDLQMLEDMNLIRNFTTSWIESGLKLLTKNEAKANGKDYVPLTTLLNQIQVNIDEWLQKMEARVSGDDGTASQIINLQNKIDDRFKFFDKGVLH